MKTMKKIKYFFAVNKGYFIYPLVIIIIIISLIIIRNYTAYRDISKLEKVAPKFIEQRGFKITSYDGYEGDMIHGGFVWYQARDTLGYLYNMAIGEWRGKLMLYNQSCLNAVKNTN